MRALHHASACAEDLVEYGMYATDEEIACVQKVVVGIKRRCEEEHYNELLEDTAKRLCQESLRIFDAIPAEVVVCIMRDMSTRDASALAATSRRMWDIFTGIHPGPTFVVVRSLKALRQLAQIPTALNSSRIATSTMMIRTLRSEMVRVRGFDKLLARYNTVFISNVSTDMNWRAWSMLNAACVESNARAVLCHDELTYVGIDEISRRLSHIQLLDIILTPELMLYGDASGPVPVKFATVPLIACDLSIVVRVHTERVGHGQLVYCSENTKRIIAGLRRLKQSGLQYIQRMVLLVKVTNGPRLPESRLVDVLESFFADLADIGLLNDTRGYGRAILAANAALYRGVFFRRYGSTTFNVSMPYDANFEWSKRADQQTP